MPRSKTRICIRIPDDLLDRFRREAVQTVESETPAGYQTLIIEALRRDCETQDYLRSVCDEGKFQPAN